MLALTIAMGFAAYRQCRWADMKSPWKLALIAGGVLLGGAVAAVIGPGLLMALAFRDMCGNEFVAEYPSPDRALKVVVFQRDCGATTGFSTQASLVPASAKLPTEGGNLFVADANHGTAPTAPWGGPTLEVRWLDSGAIVLKHHDLARIFKAERRLHGVNVSYAPMR